MLLSFFKSPGENLSICLVDLMLDRVRAVKTAKISGQLCAPEKNNEKRDIAGGGTVNELMDQNRNLSISVMLSRPILALEFNCMRMNVEAPTVVPSIAAQNVI